MTDRDPIADLRDDIREPDNDGTVLVHADDVAVLLAEHAKMGAALHLIANTTDQFGRHSNIQVHSFARAALQPASAKAGDQGTWMGGGLEITYLSAEAGDTDG
jgi:hypothetical protein